MNASEPRPPSLCYWLTGLSGAGKTTLAQAFSLRLRERGLGVLALDGDALRAGLNRDLGFGRADRAESVRRAAEIARVALDSGLIVVVSLVSPFQEDRQRARDIVGAGRFVDVFVDASLETCMRRDPKGLYQRARAGLIPEFTGVSSPYEKPVAPALHIASDRCSCSESVDILLTHLASRSIERHGIEAE